MNKKVFENERGEIELTFGEKLDEAELIKMLVIANNIIKNKKTKGKQEIKILADVSKLNQLTIAARRYGSNWLLQQPIDKVAVYGNNLFMKYFIQMLVTGLGYGNKMKFFKTRSEALKWLN